MYGHETSRSRLVIFCFFNNHSLILLLEKTLLEIIDSLLCCMRAKTSQFFSPQFIQLHWCIYRKFWPGLAGKCFSWTTSDTSCIEFVNYQWVHSAVSVLYYQWVALKSKASLKIIDCKITIHDYIAQELPKDLYNGRHFLICRILVSAWRTLWFGIHKNECKLNHFFPFFLLLFFLTVLCSSTIFLQKVLKLEECL